LEAADADGGGSGDVCRDDEADADAEAEAAADEAERPGLPSCCSCAWRRRGMACMCGVPGAGDGAYAA
jgi:hypothetical protein